MVEPQLGLGKLIEDAAGLERDAIHIAVAPVVSKCQLFPGQRITFATVDSTVAVTAADSNPIGIVDPFLEHPVPVGYWFWMWLFPNTVTGMRHHWSHPAFGIDKSVEESKKWLTDYAKGNCDLGYDEMISVVENYLVTGDRWVQHGRQSARDQMYGDVQNEFWAHFRNVTGKGPESLDENPFCCSC